VSAEFWQNLHQLVTTPIFTIGETPVSAATLLAAFLVLVGGHYLSRLLRVSVRRSFAHRGIREGTSAAIERLIHYIMLIVTVSIVLQTIGVSLGALFTAGAVFAVALGFAMQTIAQNFVSGVILLVERSIKPRDVLTIDGRLVRVQAMRIRSAIVETWDGEQLVVPNSQLVQSTVKNYTLDSDQVRLRLKVGVSYDADMDRVQEVLERVGAETAWKVAKSDVQVLLAGFGNSSVDWELAIWTRDPWSMRVSLSELHKRVWDAFKAAGVVIAYPQLDVHFDHKRPPQPPHLAGNAKSDEKEQDKT
jgi:potassium efflux system protein